MCGACWQRWRKTATPAEMANYRRFPPAVDRVLARCEQQGDCWVYTGPLDSKGYARLRANGNRKQYAHRVTWLHFRGDEWPEGLEYDHLCRNRACVNPWHGEPVPNAVNSARAIGHIGNLNRAKTHCPLGHPLYGENVRYASRGYGRVCRVCRAASSAVYRERQKEAQA